YHLQRTFKRLTGLTPRQYAAACRAGQLKAQLKKGETVTNAVYEAGYGSSSRVYENAARQLGMTPASYRKGGLDARIGYTIVNSPLGRLLVAATEKGVCFVSLGGSDAALERALKGEYPAAVIERNANGLNEWAEDLVQHLSGNQPHLELPLDVRATAFQWRVWNALRAIPYGSTRTYQDIARALGNPKAARAVGHACATNPVAVVIPCHRAVREDGGPGGYRWGVEKKQWLLAQEQKEAG
ncbi:MAG: methylated-DNA--[protein]-cysteine S-methyltransferase, partial [Anaerolineales bacterium]